MPAIQSPLNPDTDGDGISDGAEVENGLDPNTSHVDATGRETSPGCADWEKGEVYKTSLSADVVFVYEVDVNRDADADGVVLKLDRSLADYVGDALIDCDGTSARLRRRAAATSAVDGLDPSPADAAVEDGACKASVDRPEGTDCLVVEGRMTLYLREGEASSSALESSTDALKAVALAMDPAGGGTSPFVEGGGGYGVEGVRGIRYVSGTPDEGEGGTVSKDFNSGGGQDGGPAKGLAAGDGGDGAGTRALDTLEITLIAVGGLSALTLAFLVAVVVNPRREARRASSYEEFDDDGLDLKSHEDSETDVDSGSGDGYSRGDGYEDSDTIFEGLDHVVEASPGAAGEGYECPFPPPTRYEPKAGIERPRYDNPSTVTVRRIYQEDDTVSL